MNSRKKHRPHADGRHKGMLRLVFLLLGLFPALASAAGEAVDLKFTQSDYNYLYISLGLAVLSVLVGALISRAVLNRSPGNEKMQEVGAAIKQGALAYLRRQGKTIVVFVVLLAVGLYFLGHFKYAGVAVLGLPIGVWLALSFVLGVAASYIAGYSGMVMAVNANMRTANAALTSYKQALEVAFRAGAVAGLITVGMGLLGATLIFLLAGAEAMKLLIGFGFGGSLAALFMRVGGGIYTKAADVGADLVGKVEAGIPEDDPRNAATIADNVGDNVGDCAGMAADIFESYEVTLVAAIVLGAATAAVFEQATWMKLVLFALMARGVGIVASIVGILSVRGKDDERVDPLQPITKGFWVSAAIAVAGTFGLAYIMMRDINTTYFEDIAGAEVNNLRKVPMSEMRTMLAIEQVESGGPIPGQPPLPPTQKPKEQRDLPDDTLAAKVNEYLAKAHEQFKMQVPPQTVPPPKPAEITVEEIRRLRNDPFRNYTFVAQGMSRGPLVGVAQGFDSDLLLIKTSMDNPASQANPSAPKKIENWQISSPSMLAAIQSRSTILERVPLSLAVSRASGDLYWTVGAEVLEPKMYSSLPRFDYSPTKYKQPDFMSGQEPDVVLDDDRVKVVAQKQNLVEWWRFAVAIAFGVLMAFLIERLTDYFVSFEKKPVREIAATSTAGPAPMIIQGFAYGMESSVWSVMAIVVSLIAPLFIFPPGEFGGYILSFYGIALVGLGLLTTTGYILGMDTFGPISDNAQGIYQMSGARQHQTVTEGSMAGDRAVQRLDAAGNTTKALTKGFAIATAVVAAVALFHSFIEEARLVGTGLPIEIPHIFVGFLVGGAAPFLFSAFAINAVGRASFKLIGEVRRQFAADPGIMAGTSKPNYGRCVEIVTAEAQKELLGPGIIAIALPILVAFGLSIGQDPVMIGGTAYNLAGAQALGGFLAGAILSGQLLAVTLFNSGGAWDNAKKTIEDGMYGGKGSDAHKAGVVVDTVGDPFKDTAGPALNPLIKVMNLVAILLAPVVIMSMAQWVLYVIVGCAVIALGIAVYWSKRGSIGTEFQKAAAQRAGA